MQTLEVSLQAESYEIDVDCVLPNDGHIDFGLVRVGSDSVQTLSMQNKNPKYEVGFRFTMAKKTLRNFFRIEPAEGVLKPGQKDKQTVKVLFASTSEVTFANNHEIRCEYTEPGSADVLGSWTLNISVRAVFSKFTLVPAFGLNFGPLVFATSKTRKFEIRNNGEFPLEFKFVAEGTTSPDPGATAASSSTAPKKGGKGAAASSGASFTLGSFTMTPVSGSVPVGGSETVSVAFLAAGSKVFSERLRVDISDRDPGDHPGGIPYALEGESCVPGLNVTDFVSIFEEQQVVKNSDSGLLRRNVFIEDGRIFSFGTILVGESVSQRFKLSNPNKVPCDVEASVKAGSGGTAVEGGFELDVKSMSIPAHEHRYVTTTFKPEVLKAFSAVFEARVLNTDSSSKPMTFELRGEATLPHVVVASPQSSPEAGLSIAFPRCFVGKKQTRTVSIRNDGAFPAKARLSFSGSPHSPSLSRMCRSLSEGGRVTMQKSSSVRLKAESPTATSG